MAKIRAYTLPADTAPDLDDVLWVDKAGGTTRSVTLSVLERTLNGTAVTATAYVESGGNDTSARIGAPERPYATIDAALDALPANGGAVHIGIGTFAPVTKAKIKAHTKFFGSGKPANVSNTHLDYGTVIRGPLAFWGDGIEFHDLGVDSGSTVCTALYSGTAQEGLSCTTYGGTPYAVIQYVVIDNVVAMCKDATCLFHAAQLEGLSKATVSNLTTYYGIHGIAIKAINSTFSNLQSYGSANDNCIIKTDYYHRCHDVTVNGLAMGTIAGGDAGGLILSSNLTGENLENIQVTGAVANGTTYGVQFEHTDGSFYNISIGIEMLDTVSGTVNLNSLTIDDTVQINGAAVQLVVVGSSGRPAFQNSWVSLGAPNGIASYYKSNGRVYLSGGVSGGAVGSIIWTMPVGYRPAGIERISCPSNVTSEAANIAINAAGEVSLEQGNASIGWVALSGSYWVGY